MTVLIDSIFYKELAERHPADVCRRALCAYDDARAVYTVPLWDRRYAVDPLRCLVVCEDGPEFRLHPFFELFLVHYLLGAKEIAPAGRWISEKEIPGGATFFRGPHAIPTDAIARRFNGDPDAFHSGCARLGGTPLPMADAACAFIITPRIPVAVLLWKGDDEFPAESKLLFDKTIGAQLAPDIVYALAAGVCDRLGNSGQASAETA